MVGARAIIPKSIVRVSELERGLRTALSETGDGMKRDLEKVTSNWKTKVMFIKTLRNDVVTVYPRGGGREVFTYVDKGTRPHVIRPKNPNGRLVFPANYAAKTTPRSLNTKSGGASGDTIFAREVHHPGTEARDFTGTVQRKWQGVLVRRVNILIRKTTGS